MNKSQAYLQFCQLLKTLVMHESSIWKKPYEIEMLLFSLAPAYIVEDIQQSIDIMLKPCGLHRE